MLGYIFFNVGKRFYVVTSKVMFFVAGSNRGKPNLQYWNGAIITNFLFRLIDLFTARMDSKSIGYS